MVDEIFQWQELDVRLSETFTPATAIRRRDVFRGRDAVMRRLIGVANQAGQHAIIYGERGVGKTSLANVIATLLERFTSTTIASAKVNCYRETTYKEIWNGIFDQVELPQKDSYETLTPYSVIETLRNDDDRKLILVVDEFDRVEDPDIDDQFADTIKTLSDFSIDTTLILVGVADDVDDLITSHESINRCLVQIHLPRMDLDELSEIVREGIESVGMEISEDAIAQIAKLSLGLPHYAHAFGLASGQAAIDRQSRSIDDRDVMTAMSVVIKESQQTILRHFDLATASPRRQNYYFQALLACALAPTDQLGYFRPADAREPFARIMGRTHAISSIARYMHGLCDEKRGAVLQKLGESHSYRYRFTDPALQPYALMRGLERGLLTLEDVNEMTAGNY